MTSLLNRAALGAAAVALVGVLSGCPTQGNSDTTTGGPSKADVGGTCSNNDGCNSNICVSGTCRACAPGAVSCECLTNDTCNAGLVCVGDTCQQCVAGQQGCPCRADTTCDGTLECSNGVCVPDNCPAGTVGCACTSTGTCTGGVCVNNMCANCNDSTVGCPCSTGACGGGLVCDTQNGNTCRQPRPCAQAGCVTNQVCTPPANGMDARCEQQCTTGFTFNTATGMCDADPTANCDAGAPGSILATCQTQHRVCDETGSGAQCGACEPNFVDDTANPQNCRAVLTCTDIQATCTTQNRDCTPSTATADAVCGGCSAGYVEDMGGNCQVETPPATCDADGGPGSIVATCEGRGRTCVVPDGGAMAECGDCLPGQQEDPADPLRCVEPRACSEITPSCASLGRVCTTGLRAECGACVADLIQDPANPAACRKPRTCNDPDAPTCGALEYCVDGPGMEAQCMAWPCTNALGMPDTDMVRRLLPDGTPDMGANGCFECLISCDPQTEPGATGRYWPFSIKGTNTCICETERGYYYDTSGAFTTGRCDADGDGWVREAARSLIFPPDNDPTTRANARCDLQRIKQVRLENEWGEKQEFLLCQTGPVRVTPTVTECAGLVPTVYMFESTRNDDQVEVSSGSMTDLPLYGDVNEGRKLRAAEINPFTKACVSNTADYNDDKQPDLTQDQTMAPAPTLAAEYNWFMKFAYFLELHRGFYERVPNGEGTYVIQEKSRCETDFPVGYLDTTSDYWKQCSRYEAPGAANLQGRDFAQHTCTGQGQSPGCLPPPPTDITPTGGVIPPHGLCEVAGTEPLPANLQGWRGMMHSSQFRCVEVTSSSMPTAVQRTTALLAGDANSPLEVFNRCTVDCPAGDTACGTDCTGGGACATSSLPQGEGANTATPKLSCAPVTNVNAPQGAVGFVAVQYAANNNTRGCLDEFAAWPQLCPGYNPSAPQVTAGEGDREAYGQLICGCGYNYGGLDCEIGCPDSELFYSQGYNVNTREGYWMCASPARLSPSTLSQGTPNGYTLRGEIPLSGASGVLCQNADCATGYVLR